MIVVGVDPGGADTGIVIRRGDLLVWRATTHRRDQPLKAYLAAVVRDLADSIVGAREFVSDAGGWLLAVEDVVEPKPQIRITNVRGLLDTAIVLGAVLDSVLVLTVACGLGATIDEEMPSVIVRPGRHGQGPLAAYPEELRPTRGRGMGKDKLRHMRSAWDIAASGLDQWRLERTAAARSGVGR